MCLLTFIHFSFHNMMNCAKPWIKMKDEICQQNLNVGQQISCAKVLSCNLNNDTPQHCILNKTNHLIHFKGWTVLQNINYFQNNISELDCKYRALTHIHESLSKKSKFLAAAFSQTGWTIEWHTVIKNEKVRGLGFKCCMNAQNIIIVSW